MRGVLLLLRSLRRWRELGTRVRWFQNAVRGEAEHLRAVTYLRMESLGRHEGAGLKSDSKVIVEVLVLCISCMIAKGIRDTKHDPHQ